MGKTVIIAFVMLVVGSVAGGYGGFSVARSLFGSNWLQEQAVDVEERLQLLGQLRAEEVTQAIEAMEKAIDADLLSIAVDGFISDNTVSHIHSMLKATREYRTRYPRTTGNAQIDNLVALRLSGNVSD